MITLSHISKKFDTRTVVSDVSLTIKPGEIVGLLGPNGAGKTTTIRMIAGVLPPTSGAIAINGRRYEEWEDSLQEKIGYLPENNPLYDELTVEEHLKFWGGVKGLSGTALREAIEEVITKVNITDVYYRFIAELSKGYRQRVGLAQAIMGKPDILLLDEPTEGLDPNQRKDIQALLESLKKDHTVVVSSHVLSEIAKLANRIVIIHQGKVVTDDTPQHLAQGKQGSSRIITVEAKGKGLLAAFRALQGVSVVEKQGDKTYLLTVEGSYDIRPEVAKATVAVGQLFTLKETERQLEDVFAELTREES